MIVTPKRELYKRLANAFELNRIDQNTSMFTVDINDCKIIRCPECNGKTSIYCDMCDDKRLVLSYIWHLCGYYTKVALAGMENRRYISELSLLSIWNSRFFKEEYMFNGGLERYYREKKSTMNAHVRKEIEKHLGLTP
mgnify:CR=1 FL=1